MGIRETVEAESLRLNVLKLLHRLQAFILLALPKRVLSLAERTLGYFGVVGRFGHSKQGVLLLPFFISFTLCIRFGPLSAGKESLLLGHYT